MNEGYGIAESVNVVVTSSYKPFLGMYLGDIFALGMFGIVSFLLYKRLKTNNKGYYEKYTGF